MVNYLIKGKLLTGYFIACFITIVFFAPALAQASKADTVKLYYDINQRELSDVNKLKLRALNNTLSNRDSVFIFGFADYLAEKRYNLRLSAERAETIKDYLHGFQKDLNITTTGKGAVERAGARSPLGEPVNRRVDVIVVRLKQQTVGNRSRQTVKATPVPDYKVFNNKLNNLPDLKEGESISLEELTFQPGRHFLNPESTGFLERLMQYLKAHEKIQFQIVGHVCCDIEKRDALDADTHSRYLSVNRARYIFGYFLENGIERNRMTYSGVGSSKPRIWPELTEDDQYKNRRVEIIITGK